MQEVKLLTRKQLKAQTGVSGYVIDYLNDCNRLPVVKKSQGKGFPNLYHPDSIRIVKNHIAKSQRFSGEKLNESQLIPV